MAIFSPALVIAICVLFVLTKLHNYVYLFQVPLFFGLRYVQTPHPRVLTHLVAAPPSKVSPASLPARRTKLGPTYFTANEDLPYYNEINHLLALCLAYLVSALFEFALNCRSPGTLLNTRAPYVAVCVALFAAANLWRVALFLSSARVMALLTAIAAFIVVILLSVTASTDTSVTIRHAIHIALRARVRMDHALADVYASRWAFALNLLIVVYLVVVVSALAVPARRFSLLDWGLRREYLSDDPDPDAYTLPPPTLYTIVRLAADYLVPLVCLPIAGATAVDQGVLSNGVFVASLLLIGVIPRVIVTRLRLQAFLDASLDAFRMFWATRQREGSSAATKLVRTVAGTPHFSPMLAVAYLSSIAVVAVPALVALMEHAPDMGICKARPIMPFDAGRVVIANVSVGVAWICLAAYTAFAVLSVGVEAALEGAGVKRQVTEVRARRVEPTASQRRRMKREMASSQAGS